MPGCYWRDACLQTLDDQAVVELAGQLERLTTNSRVRECPELLARVGDRLAACLREIELRFLQLPLFP